MKSKNLEKERSFDSLSLAQDDSWERSFDYALGDTRYYAYDDIRGCALGDTRVTF